MKSLFSKLSKIQKENNLTILSLKYDICTDHYGKPSVKVNLIIPDGKVPIDEKGQIKKESQDAGGLYFIIQAIERELIQLEFVPNVTFVTESEQKLIP